MKKYILILGIIIAGLNSCTYEVIDELQEQVTFPANVETAESRTEYAFDYYEDGQPKYGLDVTFQYQVPYNNPDEVILTALETLFIRNGNQVSEMSAKSLENALNSLNLSTKDIRVIHTGVIVYGYSTNSYIGGSKPIT